MSDSELYAAYDYMSEGSDEPRFQSYVSADIPLFGASSTTSKSGSSRMQTIAAFHGQPVKAMSMNLSLSSSSSTESTKNKDSSNRLPQNGPLGLKPPRTTRKVSVAVDHRVRNSRLLAESVRRSSVTSGSNGIHDDIYGRVLTDGSQESRRSSFANRPRRRKRSSARSSKLSSFSVNFSHHSDVNSQSSSVMSYNGMNPSRSKWRSSDLRTRTISGFDLRPTMSTSIRETKSTLSHSGGTALNYADSSDGEYYYYETSSSQESDPPEESSESKFYRPFSAENYLWSANMVTTSGAILIMLMHLSFLGTQSVVDHYASPQFYCSVEYPMAERMRLESGGEYLSFCDMLTSMRHAYEKLNSYRNQFDHMMIGKYYCPIFKSICDEAVDLAIDVLHNAELECDGDIPFTETEISFLCFQLFDNTVFPDDINANYNVSDSSPNPTSDEDCYRVDALTINESACPDLYTKLRNDPTSPLYLFYELSPWYSNDIKYYYSFSKQQLNGRPIDLTSPEIGACGSMKTGKDMRRNIQSASSPSFNVAPNTLGQTDAVVQVLHPCGVKATTLFTDSFYLYQCNPQSCCAAQGSCCEYSKHLNYSYCVPDPTVICSCDNGLIRGNPSAYLSPPDDIRFLLIDTDRDEVSDDTADWSYINPIIPDEDYEPGLDYDDYNIEEIYNLNQELVQWIPDWLFPAKLEHPQVINWLNSRNGLGSKTATIRWGKIEADEFFDDDGFLRDINVMIRNRYHLQLDIATKKIVIGDFKANKISDYATWSTAHSSLFFVELTLFSIFLLLYLLPLVGRLIIMKLDRFESSEISSKVSTWKTSLNYSNGSDDSDVVDSPSTDETAFASDDLVWACINSSVTSWNPENDSDLSLKTRAGKF